MRRLYVLILLLGGCIDAPKPRTVYEVPSATVAAAPAPERRSGERYTAWIQTGGLTMPVVEAAEARSDWSLPCARAHIDHNFDAAFKQTAMDAMQRVLPGRVDFIEQAASANLVLTPTGGGSRLTYIQTLTQGYRVHAEVELSAVLSVLPVAGRPAAHLLVRGVADVSLRNVNGCSAFPSVAERAAQAVVADFKRDLTRVLRETLLHTPRALEPDAR